MSLPQPQKSSDLFQYVRQLRQQLSIKLVSDLNSSPALPALRAVCSLEPCSRSAFGRIALRVWTGDRHKKFSRLCRLRFRYRSRVINVTRFAQNSCPMAKAANGPECIRLKILHRFHQSYPGKRANIVAAESDPDHRLQGQFPECRRLSNSSLTYNSSIILRAPIVPARQERPRRMVSRQAAVLFF